MPTYDYTCSKCNHIWSRLLKISEREQPLAEGCPNCNELGGVSQTILAAPSLGDPFKLGRMKPDNGFKEVLQKVHERTPGSQLDQASRIKGL